MEGDSQQTPKIEADEQVTVGDTATTTQEKNASGSEGSDGFVKLEELEDSQITSKTPIEPLEEVPTQTMEQTSEEFTKLIPTEELKSTLESEKMPEEIIKSEEVQEVELEQQEAVEEVAVGEVVDTETPEPLNNVEDLEKPIEMTNESEKEVTEVSDSCKLSTVLPTSVKRGESLTEVDSEEPVMDLIYWRDVKASAAVFGLLMLFLTSMKYMSVLLVTSYLSLSLLTVTLSVRIKSLLEQTFSGTQQLNPFQGLMDLDLTVSNEKAHKYLDIILSHVNCFTSCTRELFLFQSWKKSFQLFLIIWVLRYVGLMFNGLTLLTLAVAFTFVVPVTYEMNKTQIDQYLAIANKRVSAIINKARATLPGLKPKAE